MDRLRLLFPLQMHAGSNAYAREGEKSIWLIILAFSYRAVVVWPARPSPPLLFIILSRGKDLADELLV